MAEPFTYGRRGIAARKDVVGRIMHEGRAQRLRLGGHHGRGFGIDAVRQFRLAFGLVHRRVGGRIDDQLRPHVPDHVAHLVQVRQVHPAAVHRDHFAQPLQAAFEFMADLAGISRE